MIICDLARKKPAKLTSLVRPFFSQIRGKGATRVISLLPIRVFACEMSELLANSPEGMPINMVVPTYKEKFGRDLMVTKYGYPKLIRALEAIQEILDVSTISDINFSVLNI